MKKILIALVATTSCLIAEEGMWPFNMLPYNDQLDAAWQEKVQKASLRISAGGSGSFVSPHGLVMTNHHVAGSSIYALSTQENDYMEKGFYAKTLGEELKCPNLYVEQLVAIRDVTDEVNASSKAGSASEREKLRLAATAAIKKRAQEESGLQPEVVTLYHGAKYHLYLYKRYTDVRLVMAPEKAIASFGGDEDNFEFPRYNFDIAFFRVYENGKPLESRHYLSWSKAGPQSGESLFVSGHPGHTDRQLTADHLAFVEGIIPMYLQALEDKRNALLAFAETSNENRRIAVDELAHVENARKAWTGIFQGFTTNTVVAKKRSNELDLYGSVDDPRYKPWKELKETLASVKGFFPSYWILEGRGSRYNKLFAWSRALLRSSSEKSKPNEKRLREYTDTELPALEIALFSEEPTYPELERIMLVDGLARMQKILGSDHPAVKSALAGKTVEERASDLIQGSKLFDLAFRKELYANPALIESSQDPMILLAKNLEPFARELRQRFDDEYQSVQNESYAQIAKMVFARFGETVYPDATFTLRLSAGRMKGYKEDALFVSPYTTLGGTFKHAKAHGSTGVFQLPPSWLAKEKSIKQSTPFNFVLTNDIIGGNSGSPVVNSKGEVVGLIFDGNIHSLIWDYEFDETQGRAVAVHSAGILELLQSLYGTEPLVKEILGKAAPKI